MLHVFSNWLLVAAFFGAGCFNVISRPKTQSDFVRWGYPRWWSIVTGGLEIIIAVLVALAATRMIGLALGSAIIVVATLTILRHRDFPHLAPLAVFAALITLSTFQ